MKEVLKLRWVLVLLIVFSLASLLRADIQLTTKDLDFFTWRHIGPWNFSGRITEFAVPAGQHKVYYVATASGGLWKTEDHGIHFEPIFDNYGNMSMGDVEVAPSNPQIIYLGTGEPLHARSSAHGNGMWKSVDGGKTWQHIGLEKSYFIPKIAIHPTNPDIVYVAAEGKLYDNEMDCQRGLYMTTDGGKTWTRVLDLKDRGVGDFVIDPTNPEVIIAAAYKTYRRTWTFIDRQPGNHLYKSTDGGKTWKKLTNGLPLDAKMGWNGLAIYPRNPKIVYARLDEEVNLGFDDRENRYLFRTRNLFRDGAYFNQFKSFKIDSRLSKLVKFEPLKADSSSKLVEQLNKLIQDKEFAARLEIDLDAFTQVARKVYRRDKDMLEIIDEFARFRTELEKRKSELEEVNRFVLETILTGAAEGEINPAFQKVVKFDQDKIKDAAQLWAKKDELVTNPDLWADLGLKKGSFKKAAKKALKEKPEALAQVEEMAAKADEFNQRRFYYQTINRFILQVLYGPLLGKMEPVKKAGVIYRSEDQGETWKRMTEYKIVGGSEVVNQIEAGYAGRIYVDPNNDQVLYVVEVVVKKSEDGGKTFKNTNWTGQNKCHVDTRGMWIDPLDSNHILNGNDGGVSETWDGGKHWSQKATISAQQFYDISVDNEMPYNVMGGTQDNGCWMGPSRTRNQYGVYPADWTYLPSGDGFYVVRDWWNPEFIYFESQFGFSRRMNLKTGEMISLSYRNTEEERAAGAPPQRYQWDAPIVLSPHNPGIVYVCSQHVFRSLSRGEPGTWQKISPDLSKADPNRIAQSKLTNLQYATIYTFAESPIKPGLYWAGTDDGNLQMSPDGGKTWVNITAKFYDKRGRLRKDRPKGAVLPYDRWVTRVLPSAHDVDTCYVTYSGYRTHNGDTSYIFVTHDGGKTWQDISQGMMNPVRDIEEDPDNPDILYLGTDYGIFVTFDQGKKWVKMSESAPDVIIMDMAIQKRERDLAIATYGRGFYIADIQPLKEFKEDVLAKQAHLFEPQRVVKWNMMERRGETYGEFAYTPNPPVGGYLYYWLKDKADKVKLLIKDLEGNVIQELTGGKAKGLQKVFWNLRKKPEEQDETARRFGRRMGPMVEAGVYKVTLVVNGKEVMTQKLKVEDDPVLLDKD